MRGEIFPMPTLNNKSKTHTTASLEHNENAVADPRRTRTSETVEVQAIAVGADHVCTQEGPEGI